MTGSVPSSIGLIAGKGVYPRLLAESARLQGVERIFAIAFKRETDPVIERFADETAWIRLGCLGAMLDALARSGVRRAVMAGQITPTHLFRVRMDARMLLLLKRLKARNAETIFGAVGEELRAMGIELLSAATFMEAHMPCAGLLSARAPTGEEQADIDLGLRVASITSGLDVGQTVVVKQGTILAVEAFEGTDATIRRAGRLGGPGAVVVKAAKQGHDMRFDIPVIGEKTLKLLRRIRVAVLAVEAGRCIMLEKEKLIAQADAMGLCLTVVDAGGEREA
jgi:DUF1009 family protein